MTPSGYAGTMWASHQAMASTGLSPQFTGQVESSSTIPRPRSSIWARNAASTARRAGHGLARGIGHPVKGGKHLGDPQRPAVHADVASPRRRGGLHSRQGRGRHLSARHPIEPVVDEDHRDALAAHRGVENLRGADRGQVTVALVGEHHPVGQHALDAGGHGRCAAVRRLLEVDVEVVIRQDRAADARDPDGPLADPELVDGLGDQPVDDPVRAARAVVHGNVEQGPWPPRDLDHTGTPSRAAIVCMIPAISTSVGTTPPTRP